MKYGDLLPQVTVETITIVGQQIDYPFQQYFTKVLIQRQRQTAVDTISMCINHLPHNDYF